MISETSYETKHPNSEDGDVSNMASPTLVHIESPEQTLSKKLTEAAQSESSEPNILPGLKDTWNQFLDTVKSRSGERP